MDRAKQARRPVRAQITKLINECKALLTTDPINESTLQVKMQVLQTLYSDLEEHDIKVVDKMIDAGLDDDAQDQEYQAITDYRESFLSIKIDIEKALQPDSSPTNTAFETASTVGDNRKKNFKLPKIELRKFDGELKNWLGWWSQFQKIHEDGDLHDADKIQYIFQAMEVGSESHELVSSYPQTSDNYPKIVEALKERFGRDDLLLQVYVRELLTLVISNVTATDRISLSNLYTKLESHLRSLAALKLDKELLATILFPLVESSLSVETLRAWQRSQQSKTDGSKLQPPVSRLELLMDFIKQEVHSEQQITLAQSGFGKLSAAVDVKRKKIKRTSALGEYQDEVATAAGLMTAARAGCAFCDKRHETDRCVKALQLSLEERQKKIEEKRLCYRCLRGGHIASKCRSIVQCAICSGRHYPILCPKSASSSNRAALNNDDEKEDNTTTVTASNSNQCAPDVLLYTLQAHLIGNEGTVIKINMVGDPGSQRSYIQKDLIRQLQCKLTGYEWIQNILFGGKISPAQRSGRYSVPSRNIQGGEVKTFELLEKEVICGQLPRVPKGPWLNELRHKGITITNTGDGWENIHVLLGNDYWGDVLTGRMEKLSSGLVAFETVFGWTLGGPVPKIANNLGTVVTTLMANNLDVSNLWSLEALGIIDPIELKSIEEKEKEALSYFKETVAKDGDRYVVSLPWNDLSSETRLPSNREVAEKRLNSTTRKLIKEGKIHDYHNVFLAWKREGFIDKLKEDDGNGHYLPHQPVFKTSITTPVRPVFDASCRVGHSPSLNDNLHKGPNLLELIPSLLLRFREYQIGVSADIRKAFQMVHVRTQDQQYQKFLWWEDTQCRKLVVYKHLRVVFGMTCSPFLLGAVINHHLDQVKEGSVHVAHQLKNSYYVDNCITSVKSVEEYENFRTTAITIMKGAGMKLRQWAHSFSEGFETSLSSKDEKGLNTEEDDMIETQHCISILGLLWDRTDDSLSCDIKEVTENSKVTKRHILSLVSQIFDPIGFTCPAVLLPKLLLQQSWNVKIGWDEPLPEETKKKFLKWKDEMSLLSKIKIPRLIQLPTTCKKEIHFFVDASSDFYASVGFLRSEFEGRVEVRLLTAKSRLAPIKRASIPRLELMACLIGVRQANLVRSAIQTDDMKYYFWSDSSTALAWIRRNGDWGVFVGNRVNEIRSSTRSDQWHHVPGVENPADLPSRGCTPTQLLHSKWWEGPDWLKLPKEDWPVTQEHYQEDEINKELRATSSLAATAVSMPAQPVFSSYRKCVAVWGWVLRFIRSCQGNKSTDKYLHIQELREAEKILIKQIQHESFPDGGSIISGISVYKDKENLLRVKTKLSNSRDTEDFKFPVLLPRSHPLVELLIENAHTSYCHGGVQFLISKLREKYWILQSRRIISKIVHRCIKCKRHQGQPMNVDPAALPEGRVTISEPFSTTGVDLAGPLTLKDGSKAWIVLYTCAVFRGIYLDLVSSLSTEAFIGSLERFIGICGRPSTIYSDNGTNFVGAAHLFRSLDWESIKERSNAQQIQWIFNPPTAAWWGGWWERLVRSVKDLLKRMLGREKLSYDQLRTCLAGVAAVINDRPLTVVTEDNGDLIPLTPNIFMRGRMAGILEETNEAEFLSKSYRRMKKLQEQVQARFRKEYLSQLVIKANEKKTHHAQVGDIVLVGADGKKRYEWPLGKIEELFAGKDGKVRVARVKTQGGILLRPLQRLYPLEVPKQDIISGAGDNTTTVSKVKTRLGRVVNSPVRYGQWLHLISN